MNTEAKQKVPEFDVADGWPNRRVTADIRAGAVQALVANHTLIVGQSRSGKTNAARRIIEEILTWTRARVVILDPNADFKLLSQLDPDRAKKIEQEDQRFTQKLSELAPTIRVATPDGSAWGIDWSKLRLEEMAAFLRLTPSENFSEYRHLDRHYRFEKESTGGLGTLEEFINSKYFQFAVGEDVERYRLRLQELNHLDAWAKSGKEDLDSLLIEDNKAVVVDLSIDDEQVKRITIARTLEVIWEQGEKKRKDFLGSRETSWPGTLAVIDEGHLFAPPETLDPQKRLVSERIQRFADQGKKLNLFLMVITQQPGKLHSAVLSEFNNRVIMRVNERRSLRALEEMYGGSKGRYDGSLTFEQGEALIEGDLLRDENPPPALPRGVKFKRARTQEGGGTPKPDWAKPQDSPPPPGKGLD